MVKVQKEKVKLKITINAKKLKEFQERKKLKSRKSVTLKLRQNFVSTLQEKESKSRILAMEKVKNAEISFNFCVVKKVRGKDVEEK